MLSMLQLTFLLSLFLNVRVRFEFTYQTALEDGLFFSETIIIIQFILSSVHVAD